MQEIRLWEVVKEKTLRKIPGSEIAFEERLEEWLAKDISVLDTSLLVIGRQVRTDFGGYIDLLCMDNLGNSVVVELKKGQTPRDTAAQALEYASWVKDLSYDDIAAIADEYLKQLGSGSLKEAFLQRFGVEVPDEINQEHRSLILAEAIDDRTDRIVRYLADIEVPINVATVQHFEDSDGRRLVARVFLVEQGKDEARLRRSSRRGPYQTVAGLQAMAEESDIGDLYSRVREGVRGVLRAYPYTDRVFYQLTREDGSVRTVLIVQATPHEEHGGLGFTVHVTRLENQWGVEKGTVEKWLPSNSRELSLTGWSGSSEEEKRNAMGFNGSFQNEDEVDKFLTGLKAASEASAPI